MLVSCLPTWRELALAPAWAPRLAAVDATHTRAVPAAHTPIAEVYRAGWAISSETGPYIHSIGPLVPFSHSRDAIYKLSML